MIPEIYIIARKLSLIYLKGYQDLIEENSSHCYCSGNYLTNK